MIITILEAEVTEDNWGALKSAYAREVAVVPPEITQTILLQSKQHPTTWRIVTEWRSAEDLQRMRATTEVPTGIRIFNEANAQPTFSSWEVTHQSR